MLNRSKYGTILKILLIICAVAIVGVIVVIGYKTYSSYYIIKGAEAAVIQFEDAIKNNNMSDEKIIKYKEFTVIGTIKIPTIELKYPILQENTTDALETSVVLMYTSQGLNNSGNSLITGHNYRNKTMFSNLNKLSKNDFIYITDNTGKEIKYQIYNIYETSDNENTYITRNTNGNKEITLLTSSDNSKQKTIIFAREK